MAKLMVLISGSKFNRLTVVEFSHYDKRNRKILLYGYTKLLIIQKPWHKVKKFINKGYKIIGMVYWNDGKFDAVMSKEC